MRRRNMILLSVTSTIFHSLFDTLRYVFSATRCPNKFGIRQEMFASEASYVYNKIVFCSKKLLFEPFL